MTGGIIKEKEKYLTENTSLLALLFQTNSCLPLARRFLFTYCENPMIEYEKPLCVFQDIPLIVKQSSPISQNESDAVEQQAHRHYHHFQPI